MNSDYFVTNNYKISKPNNFFYIDLIKHDTHGVICMDCYDAYDLLKKDNLNIYEIENLQNFLFQYTKKYQTKYSQSKYSQSKYSQSKYVKTTNTM